MCSLEKITASLMNGRSFFIHYGMYLLANENIKPQQDRMMNYLQAVQPKVSVKGAVSVLTSLQYNTKLFIQAVILLLKGLCELRGIPGLKAVILLTRMHRRASLSSPLPQPSVPILYGCHTVVPVSRQGKPGIFWDDCLSF